MSNEKYDHMKEKARLWYEKALENKEEYNNLLKMYENVKEENEKLNYKIKLITDTLNNSRQRNEEEYKQPQNYEKQYSEKNYDQDYNSDNEKDYNQNSSDSDDSD